MSKSIILSFFVVLMIVEVASARDVDPEKGKYYTFGQIGVKKMEVVGSKIKMTFRPITELAYWCPGITVKETKEAVAVTFVRCKTFKTCAIDAGAKIGNHVIRTITIDTRGKDTYVKNGPKQYKKIYSAKKKEDVQKQEVRKGKQLQPPTQGNVRAPDNAGWIDNKHVRSGQVKR